MEVGTRFAKTVKGVDEMNSRGSVLRGKLRMMLILTDPSKPAQTLLDTAARIGAAPDWLDLLQREGYVAPVSGSGSGSAPVFRSPGTAGAAAPAPVPVDAARQFMCDTLQAALGARAGELVRRIGECETVDALAPLVRAYENAIAEVSGVHEAEALAARLRKLLG